MSWTDKPLVSNITSMKRDHFTELRNAVNAELARRNMPQKTWNTGAVIQEAQATELRNAINDAATIGVTWQGSYSIGGGQTKNYFIGCPTDAVVAKVWTDPVIKGIFAKAVHGNEMRDVVDLLSTQCPCNCNYCTCNCNYCTCNCNYCTCNCDHGHRW